MTKLCDGSSLQIAIVHTDPVWHCFITTLGSIAIGDKRCGLVVVEMNRELPTRASNVSGGYEIGVYRGFSQYWPLAMLCG